MDALRQLVSEHHLMVALAAMIARVREAGRIDWTIPATWIVGLFFGMIVNLGVLVWGAATVVGKLNYVINEQAKDALSIARQRDMQSAMQSELASLKARQEQKDAEQMHRIELLEADGRAKKR